MGNLSLQCRKCSSDFDLSGSKPRTLPSCDHSLCEKCLDKMLVGATNKVNCLVCAKLYEFPPEYRISKKDFPEDSVTLGEILMRRPPNLSKGVCATHQLPLTHVCLDTARCANKDLGCLKCLKSQHAQCHPELIVLAATFDKEIAIERPTLDVPAWATQLKQAISKQVKDLETRLAMFVDAAASLICYQHRTVSYVCPSSVKYMTDFIESRFDPVAKRVSVSYRKQALLTEFAKDISDCLSADLWKALRAKENDQLTFAFRKHFLLKRNVTKQDEEIVRRLENPNPQAKEKYILPYLEFDSNMTLDEYGARLMNLCHLVPRDHERRAAVNFSKMKPDLQERLTAVVQRLAGDKSIPAFRLSRAIEEEVGREAPRRGGQWRCVHNPTCFTYESRFGEHYLDLSVEGSRFVLFHEPA